MFARNFQIVAVMAEYKYCSRFMSVIIIKIVHENK